MRKFKLTAILLALSIPSVTFAATEVSIKDMASYLEIAPSTRSVRLKDTEDKRLLAMYDMGLVNVTNGSVEPDRKLTNGEILFMVARHSDLINDTSYTLEGYNSLVYYTEKDLNEAEIKQLVIDLKTLDKKE